jgi:hypothetical protein
VDTPDQGQDREGLLPPQQILLRGESLPVIEPPLRDLRPPETPVQAEQWEPVSSGPLEIQNQLTEELAQRAQDTVLDTEEVRQVLDDKRYIAIGASLLEDRIENTISLVFILYNYTDNLAVEVSLDEYGQEVTEVMEARYQPPPLQEEIDRAIQLAREDSRLATRYLSEHFEGTALLVSSVDPEDPYYNHRQFDVRFGRPDERLPRYGALVDLSTETVLRAGALRPPPKPPPYPTEPLPPSTQLNPQPLPPTNSE